MGTQNRLSLAGFALLMAILPFFIGEESYWLTVMVISGIYSMITIGLCLLLGFAGQISLGHGAFFGLGAYSSGLLTTLWHLNPWLALVVSQIITMGIALCIGFPTLRLSGHYLAMATLAFGEIVAIFFTAEVNLTGGPSGFGDIPRLSLFGYVLDTDLKNYFFIWMLVVILLWLCLNLIHSRIGRALRSIHGGEAAANAMGVNTTLVKIQVFVISALLASFAGSIYSHYMSFVSPAASELRVSVLLVVMVAVGGMNRIWGAVLGAVLLTILPEYLSAFKDFDMLIYGMILMMIMIFLPHGLMGGIVSLWNRLQSTAQR